MNGRNTSIIALLTLALGSGLGYIKFVSPALAERNKLQTENGQLLNTASELNAEVASIRARVNNMAMSTIAYFDLTPFTSNKRRIMEAKTVETLASLTEILNDNHIKIKNMTPTGETTGMNKPVVTPPPAPAGSPGTTPPAPTPVAATPTPVPGSTPTPPPISLTHKTFSFDIQGEYPDLVKALTEIQGLPRAISINAFKVNLIHEEGPKAKAPAEPLPGENTSPSLLAMQFDISITFLMDTGGIVQPLPVESTPPAKHAEGWLAWSLETVCPPAAAAEAQPLLLPARTIPRHVQVSHGLSAPRHAAVPRSVVRPLNSLQDVVWSGNTLQLKMAHGTSPRFHVVGMRPGFLVVQLDRTVTTGATFFHPQGPGIRQITAISAPHDPLSTHLVIAADSDTRLRAVLGADQLLHISVEQQGHPRSLAAPTAAMGPPTPRQAMGPSAPQGRAQAPLPSSQEAVLAAKVVPPVKAKPRPIQPILALLPPHAVPRLDSAATEPRSSAGTVKRVPGVAPVGPAPGAAPSVDSLKIIVRPIGSRPLLDAAPIPGSEGQDDHVAPETVQAWEQHRLGDLTEMAAPLHGAVAPVTGLPLAQSAVVAPYPLPIPESPLTAPETTGQAEAAQTVVGANEIPLAPPDVPAAQPDGLPVMPVPPLEMAAEAPAVGPAPRVTPAATTTLHRRSVFEPPHAPSRAPAPAAAHWQTAVHPAGRPQARHPRNPVEGFETPEPSRFQPVSEPLAQLDGARLQGNDLLIVTHGAAPRFRLLGGNQKLLLIAVDNMPMPGLGKLITVGHAGIKQVRAALYDNHTPTTHLAIDTDGTVRLEPSIDAEGRLHLHIAPLAVRVQKPVPVPAVSSSEQVTADVTTSAISTTADGAPLRPYATRRTHAVPAANRLRPTHVFPHPMHVAVLPLRHHLEQTPVAKPVHLPPTEVTGVPGTPQATPTPMAVPHETPRHPASVAGRIGKPTHTGTFAGDKPNHTPLPAPTPMTQGHNETLFEGRHLQSHASQGSYRFPIDRDRITGRSNPFRPLANPLVSPTLSSAGVKAGLPVVPVAPAIQGVGAKPGAPQLTFMLKAVMVGGGVPPSALLSVGGKTLQVGLNQSLPGNARVKSIQTDFIILSANGHDIRLNLKR